MKLPSITNKFATPKPWQIGVGVGIVIIFVFLAPAVHQMMAVKKKQDIFALSRVGQPGEAWHPAAFPAPPPSPIQHPPPAPPPTPPGSPSLPPLAVMTTSPHTLIAGPPGKPPVDPEQEAINAPILINSGSAGGGSPPPSSTTQASHGSNLPGENGAASSSPSSMASLLKPTELTGYRATIMQHPGTTIEQGRIIQCNSVTRMTSGLPGFVRAKVAYDVWSADNTMKLIDRDSMIFGEIAHGLTNGQDRLFVLWHQITTPPPNLVRITLNSPAADEMGEAGMTGDIDHHYMQKIGGALLLSGVDTLLSGVSSGLQNALSGRGNSGQQQNNGLNFYQFQGQGSNLASQLLQSTIQIPDTLTVNQSAPCSIFVSGDLRFDDVYVAARRTVR